MVNWPWRRKRWEPVGDTVSLETTLQQATQALESAGTYATRTRSAKDMNDVAHGWMRMTETLSGLAAMSESGGTGKAPWRTGFGPAEVDESSKTEIVGEEEDYE